MLRAVIPKAVDIVGVDSIAFFHADVMRSVFVKLKDLSCLHRFFLLPARSGGALADYKILCGDFKVFFQKLKLRTRGNLIIDFFSDIVFHVFGDYIP